MVVVHPQPKCLVEHHWLIAHVCYRGINGDEITLEFDVVKYHAHCAIIGKGEALSRNRYWNHNFEGLALERIGCQHHVFGEG